MKKSRKIVTFEPETDVEAMLKRAKENGLTTTDVLNKAIRDCGADVIRELAQEHVKRLKKLATASFDDLDCQPAGELIAA